MADELRPEKFREAVQCLKLLKPVIDEFHGGVNVWVYDIDEKTGILVLQGEKLVGGLPCPFIIVEPLLTSLSRTFEQHVSWINQVVDVTSLGSGEAFV